MLFLSLILGPVADDYLFISWQIAKAQDKIEHSSTLKSSAQNTPADFPLARASHMAQLKISDECSACSKRHSNFYGGDMGSGCYYIMGVKN